MNNSGFKYTLERGSKKVNCPNCLKKTFVRYVDIESQSYLPDSFGRCDREEKCGYFKQPEKENNFTPVDPATIVIPEPTFLPLDYVDRYYNTEEEKRNNFIIFLRSFLPQSKVEKIVKEYFISTCFHWNGGATIFWQIDQNENVRT
ncbi:PG0870-related protein [Antarcticibacterium sp. 1MA-6-2]|uniref:PG0870-related protein n=1 Tax=Antarcticibacterium sp. 1MA-6-2 TaxID=2908210 RepID=UPI0021037ECE|nr:PG0870-related protein [Antarcticibacterium sp. 1MA-6-2]